METIQSLLSQYGLLIVLIGTFLEGETIVILAGFAAHQGLLNPVGVALTAFAGSFAADQCWFYTARHFQNRPIIQKAVLRPAFQRAFRFLERYPTAFILSFRFIYGVRNVSPIVIGLSDISALRFTALNAIAAAVWAAMFTFVGFMFANAAEHFLGELKKAEHAILIGIMIFIFVYGLYRIALHFFSKKQK